MTIHWKHYPEFEKVEVDLLTYLRDHPNSERWMIMQSLLPYPSMVIGYHLQKLMDDGLVNNLGIQEKSHFAIYSLST